MSNDLATNERNALLAQEAEANTQLMQVVSKMREYKDTNGSGPKEGSLKGIMLQVGIRVVKSYGFKIGEMTSPMLAHVRSTKIDTALLIERMMRMGESYERIKKSCWEFIDSRGNEFHNTRGF